ncbi:response regulator [Paenibacillus sp. GCM10027626]|uniref:response regulator transcription factor n=1 Tax=Paenibacillus sp. GCM10027626 TaxID=3273411 RepID=UPI00362DF592
MYRLLIVDDEPAIVDGLVQQFQELPELELDVCKAYSAHEALAIVKATKIDLVVSDIRMPGKSGLQLADDISFYWPACRIVLLSGYSEFEYVYSAIQKNVDHYILKTEGTEAIVAAVRSSAAKLTEEQRRQAVLERAEQQITAAEPLLKKQFFEAILLGEHASDIRRSGTFADLPLRLDDSRPLLLVVGKADLDGRGESYTEKLKLFYSVQEVFERHLPSMFTAEHVVHDHSLLVWFIQPACDKGEKFTGADGEMNWRDVTTYLKGVLEPVQNECSSTLGTAISFALDRGEIEWNELGAHFEQLKFSLKQHAAFGQPMAVIDLGMQDGLWKADAARPAQATGTFNQKLGLLTKKLESGAEADAAMLTEELLAGIRSDLAANYLLGMERYYTLLLAFIGQMEDLHTASLPVIELPVEWHTAQQKFSGLAETICREKKARIEKGEHLLVERIHQYIDEHLGGDLSLARIAEAVYFNPSYLSRFYKQLTGRNISEAINTAKSAAAQTMLGDTSLKVNEIALKLGFESPSYFTAFFRKMTGSTPQEFRENLFR